MPAHTSLLFSPTPSAVVGERFPGLLERTDTTPLGSVDRYKLPDNYHWPTDTPDNVDFSTTADAVTLCLQVVQNLAVRGWTSPTHQK